MTFVRVLLLRPVTSIGHYDRRAERRHKFERFGIRRSMLGKPESPPPGHDRPRDTERRHRDLCPGKRRQKFSVTVNIAVSVEAAATEPGALEFTGVESTSAW